MKVNYWTLKTARLVEMVCVDKEEEVLCWWCLCCVVRWGERVFVSSVCGGIGFIYADAWLLSFLSRVQTPGGSRTLSRGLYKRLPPTPVPSSLNPITNPHQPISLVTAQHLCETASLTASFQRDQPKAIVSRFLYVLFMSFIVTFTHDTFTFSDVISVSFISLCRAHDLGVVGSTSGELQENTNV